jgi:hypothetical protein
MIEWTKACEKKDMGKSTALVPATIIQVTDDESQVSQIGSTVEEQQDVRVLKDLKVLLHNPAGTSLCSATYSPHKTHLLAHQSRERHPSYQSFDACPNPSSSLCSQDPSKTIEGPFQHTVHSIEHQNTSLEVLDPSGT